MATEEETGPTLVALREERNALEAELAAMQPPANVITLHPGAVKRYLEMVNDLATSLPRCVPSRAMKAFHRFAGTHIPRHRHANRERSAHYRRHRTLGCPGRRRPVPGLAW
jgi:hypothetical protein